MELWQLIGYFKLPYDDESAVFEVVVTEAVCSTTYALGRPTPGDSARRRHAMPSPHYIFMILLYQSVCLP